MKQKNENAPRPGGAGESPKQTRHVPVLYQLQCDRPRPLFGIVRPVGYAHQSAFITARIFGEPFKVIKIDKAAVEYYTRLTALYSQYRGIAVNYNQVVKALNTNFSEKKALAFLYKLEKATIELADLNRQIIELTREFETRWLQR